VLRQGLSKENVTFLEKQKIQIFTDLVFQLKWDREIASKTDMKNKVHKWHTSTLKSKEKVLNSNDFGWPKSAFIDRS